MIRMSWAVVPMISWKLIDKNEIINSIGKLQVNMKEKIAYAIKLIDWIMACWFDMFTIQRCYLKPIHIIYKLLSWNRFHFLCTITISFDFNAHYIYIYDTAEYIDTCFHAPQQNFQSEPIKIDCQMLLKCCYNPEHVEEWAEIVFHYSLCGFVCVAKVIWNFVVLSGALCVSVGMHICILNSKNRIIPNLLRLAIIIINKRIYWTTKPFLIRLWLIEHHCSVYHCYGSSWIGSLMKMYTSFC